MNIRRNESGTGIVEILLIIVVIGILGFTGWFVWQSQQKANTTLDETNNSQNATYTKQTVSKGDSSTLVTKEINKGFGVTMTYSYPKTWKLTDVVAGPMPLNESKGNTSEVVTITSPSGKYKVVYQIGANGGLGGICMPEEGGTIRLLTSTPLTSFSNTSYTETYADGIATEIRNDKVLARGTSYSAAIMATDKVTATAVGESSCDLYLANVITLAEKNNVTLLGASIKIPNLSKDATQSEFQAMLTGPEYQQAKAILLSTSVK